MPSMAIDEILSGLNENQRKAVVHEGSNLLVVAGAGSGKTRVLTYRVAYLIARGVSPSSILALTFTNKAANEMKSRIASLVGEKASSVVSGTFHSIALRWLKMYGSIIGIPRDFVVYDDSDSRSLVRRILKDMGEDEKLTSQVYSRISYWKNHGINPKSAPLKDELDVIAVEVFNVYKSRLLENAALDFDDFLLALLRLLDTPEGQAKLKGRFKHILVDEYQDTNPVQERLLLSLKGDSTYITAVGDEDQAIYGFRGATVDNILRFEQVFPPAEVVFLEHNYRSGKRILDVATRLISNNLYRRGKVLKPVKDGPGQVRLFESEMDYEEAELVVDFIYTWERKGIPLNEMAVFYRTNFLSRRIEDALRREGIPYRVFGGIGFYERKEIKDILAYLKFAVNPRDEASFERIVSNLKVGVGPATIRKIKEMGEGDFLKGLKKLSSISPKIVDLFRFLRRLHEARENMSPSQAIEEILNSLYGRVLELDRKYQERLENIGELVTIAREWEISGYASTIADFVADFSLLTDIDIEKEGDYISLMTVHTAKGLEFASVFIVGMEEGLFPHYKSIAEGSIEEERRLAYVAFTRAKENLVISYVRKRNLHGRIKEMEPSRFLYEAGLLKGGI